MSMQRLVVIGLERTGNVWRVATRGHRWSDAEAEHVETIVFHEVSQQEAFSIMLCLSNLDELKAKLQFPAISMNLEIIDEVQ